MDLIHGVLVDSGGNVIISGVDNSSSSHSNNWKNNVLVLAEVPTDDVNDSIGTAEQKFGLNLIKRKTKFCLSLHYNDDNSYLLTRKKSPS